MQALGLRLAVTVVAALLAGFFLQATGLGESLDTSAAARSRPATTVEATAAASVASPAAHGAAVTGVTGVTGVPVAELSGIAAVQPVATVETAGTPSTSGAGVVGVAGGLVTEPAHDGAGDPAAVIETATGAVTPAAVTGRSWASSWPWATSRAVATALGLVVAAVALLAARPGRAVVAWRLLRPDRTLATARHCSPLAARRAPPAPAGC